MGDEDDQRPQRSRQRPDAAGALERSDLAHVERRREPGADTPGTGATDAAAVLRSGAAIGPRDLLDNSNDDVSTIPTRFYPGPEDRLLPAAGLHGPGDDAPDPAGRRRPGGPLRHDLHDPGDLVAGAEGAAGAADRAPVRRCPPLDDTDAGELAALHLGRPGRGHDRDEPNADISQARRVGLKLGDIFHSNPLIVGRPADFAVLRRQPEQLPGVLQDLSTAAPGPLRRRERRPAPRLRHRRASTGTRRSARLSPTGHAALLRPRDRASSSSPTRRARSCRSSSP